ncbi:multiple myeloma tumor-associated protein 2 homolog [Rhopilema esculentum]|uniref:multiple myeloma tumor-associated protein 2 homolog n=1 Tax=Rhopilema esculentum TaxID=499914 RepID=UPI0031D32192
MSANIYHPSRGGVRGGKDQFNWEDVKSDKDRENYLGHSLKAPVGRWQKGKDLVWYTKDKEDGISEEDRRKKELQGVRDLEAQAMAEALGFKVPPYPVTKADDKVQDSIKSSEGQRDRESRKKSKRKKDKKDKKSKKKKRRYESSDHEDSEEDLVARATMGRHEEKDKYGDDNYLSKKKKRIDDWKDPHGRDSEEKHKRRRDDYDNRNRYKERYTKDSRSDDDRKEEREHRAEKVNRNVRQDNGFYKRDSNRSDRRRYDGE